MIINLNKKTSKKLIAAIAMAGVVGSSAILPVNAATKPSVSIESHVAYKGWLQENNATNGVTFGGTTGEGLQLEALKIKMKDAENVKLTFDVHVAYKGWLMQLTEKDVLGTVGAGLPIEAIRIHAEGLDELGYKIQYRAHVAYKGWMDWMEDSHTAGTEGQSLPMEAIEIRVVEKGSVNPPVEDKTLEEVKANAIKELEAYKNSDIKSIRSIAKNGERAIKAATTKEEVAEILEDTKGAAEAYGEMATILDRVNAIYFDGPRKDAKAALNTNVGTPLQYIVYTDNTNTKVAGTAIVDGSGKLTSTYESVKNAYNNAVKSIESSVVVDEMNKIAEDSANFIKLLNYAEDSFKDAPNKEVTQVKNIIDGVIKGITEKSTQAQVDEAITKAKAEIDKENDLVTAIGTAIATFENSYINALNANLPTGATALYNLDVENNKTYKDLFKDEIEKQKASINTAKTAEEADELAKAAEKAMLPVVKEKLMSIYKEQFDHYYNLTDKEEIKKDAKTVYVTEYDYNKYSNSIKSIVNSTDNNGVEGTNGVNDVYAKFDEAIQARVNGADLLVSKDVMNQIEAYDKANYDMSAYSTTEVDNGAGEKTTARKELEKVLDTYKAKFEAMLGDSRDLTETTYKTNSAEAQAAVEDIIPDSSTDEMVKNFKNDIIAMKNGTYKNPADGKFYKFANETSYTEYLEIANNIIKRSVLTATQNEILSTDGNILVEVTK